MCVQTLADCLGEITSVEFDREGKYLLAGCKDNSNRLFDLRMVRALSFLYISISSLFPSGHISRQEDTLIRERGGKLMIATKPISLYRAPKHIQEPNPIPFRLQRQFDNIRIRRWSSLHLAPRIQSRTHRTPKIDNTSK
jgi:hypothetical protein